MIRRIFSFFFQAVRNSLLRKTGVFLAAIVLVIGASLFPAKIGKASELSVTDNGSTLVVDTGAGLVYTVDKSNDDLISAKLSGIELTTSGGKHSQIASGLGSSTTKVTWNLDPTDHIVTIAATSSAIMSNGGSITHYYISRAGENIIYMATYTTSEPRVGELRYIFRGNSKVLTNVPPDSDLRGSLGNIESRDIFGFSDGHTASKYYGNSQAKDLTIQGDTGNGVGVFMAYGSRETSSGGPFFRDIQFQSGGDSEIYNYMNSGHNQTEPFRTGLHGPYALVFTNGSTPKVPDFKWMASLGLQGWVYDRGSVVLNGLTGMDKNYTYTIGFANSTAQYWTTAQPSGEARSDGMIPGTYKMTVYKGELGVYSENVTVKAGKTSIVHKRAITGDPSQTATIWRIGDWDGTPLEFLNGSHISQMHPSDIRNANWGPVTFQVGNPASQFPAVQFRKDNSPTTVTFNLTQAQAASAHTLKIGITAAYNGGRPDVIINGNNVGFSSPSAQPKSRSITIGTYRGNNTTFTWNIPASDFVAGTNTLTITPVSGSRDLSPWLSAGWAYDCLELDQ